MGYRLKSGLGKTVIYQAVSQYVPEGFVLPKLRECYFRGCHDNYRLKFSVDDFSYEANFSVYVGGVHVRLTSLSYPDDENVVLSLISFNVVPFEYLLSHNMLREVS